MGEAQQMVTEPETDARYPLLPEAGEEDVDPLGRLADGIGQEAPSMEPEEDPTHQSHFEEFSHDFKLAN